MKRIRPLPSVAIKPIFSLPPQNLIRTLTNQRSKVFWLLPLLPIPILISPTLKGNSMRNLNKLTAICLLMLAPYSAGAAPTSTNEGYVTFMEGGWVSASLRVQLSSGNNTNPSACSILDGYTTDPSDSGYQLFNSMLLSAYLANRKVRLTIDGCVSGRPRIISVVILPN